MKYGTSGPDVRALQQRLNLTGHADCAVKVDDDFGPSTAAALAAWAARSLPALPKAEVPIIAAADEPAWLTAARAEIGVREVPGSEHNPRIVEYHAATSYKASTDEVPWCASFVSFVLESVGLTSTKSATARSYERGWGQPLANNAVAAGAVVVFWRGQYKKDGKGHVGFYVGGDPAKGRIAVLGGNQDDGVRISTYATDRLVGFYWPKEAALPAAQAIMAALALDPGALAAQKWA